MSSWKSMTLIALLWLIASPAGAGDLAPRTDRERSQQDEIGELKRKLDVVLDRLDEVETGMVIPKDKELKSAYGLGPAASKVYGASQGISIGGYAEGFYSNVIGDAAGDGNNTADLVRTVLYFGYKFNDSIIFNTELEFEHASTDKSGSVSVEFATLDYLISDEFNVRGGLMLIPMGFINEIHEPPFYFGTQRPEPEQSIIPTTWRENGVGIFGTMQEKLHYKLYVVNSLDAAGFTSSGVRGGRQKGSKVKAEDLSFIARLDLDVTPDFLIGGSIMTGNAGHDQVLALTGAKLPHVKTRIVEVHSQLNCGLWQLRALATHASLGDTGKLSNLLSAEATAAAGAPRTVVVASEMVGGYGEVGFDFWQWMFPNSEKSLSPFLRFEFVDTQSDIAGGFTRDRSKRKRIIVPGLHFKPHPQVVLKMDYRNIHTYGGNAADELNVGFGLVF